MWSYYGSKSKLVRYYPEPKYGKIIEPFAGTAKYALKYWENDVILTEMYPKIYRIWKFLQQASPNDILSLPDIGYKQKIPITLSDEERWLMGYCVGRGSPRPATMGHKFNSWDRDKIRIAGDLHKIKHWDIRNESYETLENDKATWFIDPPYQKMGYKYNFNGSKLDFNALGEWCKSRDGLVIVCENIDAQWLPFVELKRFVGAQKTNIEAVYLQDETKTNG